MSPKPACLLLDANAVFAAFQSGAWDALTERYQVVLPAIVVRIEGQFYVNGDGKRVYIDLPAVVASGTVVEWEGTATQLADVRGRFKPSFAQGLDDGELEAIACLLSDSLRDAVFVTADRIAIQAIAMLDIGERGMSLEEALDRCGHMKKLPVQQCKAFFTQCLEEGKRRLVTREGLA